jgi:fatty-acyl-CoA synthase
MPAQELFFHDLLSRAARGVPDREALVFLPGRGAGALRFTYAEFAKAVERVARALLACEVGRGGVVGVYAANRPEFVLLQLACSQLGAAAVPINPLYERDELAYVLERARVEVCFADHGHRGSDLWPRLLGVAPGLAKLRLLVAFSPASGHSLSWEDWLDAGRTVSDEQFEAGQSAARPTDVAQIEFTSGTTGRPKAVQLTSYAMANGGRCTAYRAGLEDGCRYVHAMPFFHVGGSITAMAATIAVQGTHIFLPRFSPAAVCAAIENERATAMLGVPTMLISLADRAQQDDCSFATLRTVLTGGSLVPAVVAQQWMDRYGVGMSNTYGMTEVCGPNVQTSPDDPRDRALNTVGRPLPGIEVDVVQVGATERVAFGEEGEIRFRGWGTMRGYLGDPAATQAVLSDDGWMRSGDLGRLSADGYVRVTGRAKDLIIRGGENIAPAAVEDAIRAHVEEVVDVHVVGVPDDYYGEAIAAYVTLRTGATLDHDGLVSRLQGRLNSYLVPAHLRVVNEFPTTPSGKVQKFRLVKMFTSESPPRGGAEAAVTEADHSET